MKESIFITVTDRKGEVQTLECPLGVDLSVMEFLKSYEYPIKATCGGMALCSTCHCYIMNDTELPEIQDAEEDMLDQAFFVEDNSRLTCQLKVTEELDGLELKIAPEDEEV